LRWIAFSIRRMREATASPLLSVDLDDFKEANDVFGHVVGDELLCDVARRLERAVGKEFIARVGGDEFIVLSTQGEQPQPAALLAERVLKAVNEDFDSRQQKIPIGLSIGAAIYPRLKLLGVRIAVDDSAPAMRHCRRCNRSPSTRSRSIGRSSRVSIITASPRRACAP